MYQIRRISNLVALIYCMIYQYRAFLIHSLDIDSNLDELEFDKVHSESEVDRTLRHDTNKNHRHLQSSSTWEGCVDPNNPNPEDNLVSVGKRTTICIVVSQGGNWGNGNFYSRWVFQPTADEYSHFVIASSYTSLVKNPSNFYYPAISVHVESQQSLSFIRRYFDDSYFQSWVFPYLTAIVSVKNGVVTGITWDESCAFCDESRCVENTYDFSGKNITKSTEGIPSKSCYFTKAECDNLVAKGEKTCSLGVYFVWTGTDKDKKVFSSVNSRFGAFPPNKIPKIEKYLPKFNIPVFGS